MGVPVLEPNRDAHFAGWRMGGTAAWLELAAHFVAHLEFGPWHYASVEGGGTEVAPAPMVTKWLGEEF